MLSGHISILVHCQKETLSLLFSRKNLFLHYLVNLKWQVDGWQQAGEHSVALNSIRARKLLRGLWAPRAEREREDIGIIIAR